MINLTEIKSGDRIKNIITGTEYTVTAVGKYSFLTSVNGLRNENWVTQSDFDCYEIIKPKKKYVMYRHWFINRYDRLDKLETHRSRDELTDKDNYVKKHIETEIIKEIEVDSE